MNPTKKETEIIKPEKKEQINGTFDKGVNYSDAHKRFSGLINQLIGQAFLDYHDENRLLYLIISLIQLQNGSRICETLRALNLFVADNSQRIVVIPIAKRKDGVKREILLPDLISPGLIERIKPKIENNSTKHLSGRVRMYLTNYYGWNTHSLRYALINYLTIEKKQPLNLVSKLVGHKNMNQLISYTQNQHVSALLTSINDGTV